jgi:hypothetical protein
MVAVATPECVLLLDFESSTELKFNQRIDVPNVVFITYIDIYIVTMSASDDDPSEATLSARLLYGAEEGSLQIKRF